jgi:hypothetical protein
MSTFTKKRIESASLMKTLTWSAAVLALLIPTAAVAGPGDKKFGTGGGTTPPVGSPEVLMCNTKLDSLVAALKKPGNSPFVTSVSTIIIGSTTGATAYAEGVLISPGTGFEENVDGKAGLLFGGPSIGGSGKLGALPKNEVHTLNFSITNGLPSKAKFVWVFQGNTYQSVVDSCEGSYWTATAGNSTTTSSAIAIKLGPVVKSPPPPE